MTRVCARAFVPFVCQDRGAAVEKLDAMFFQVTMTGLVMTTLVSAWTLPPTQTQRRDVLPGDDGLVTTGLVMT
jgi:hypothetical protein